MVIPKNVDSFSSELKKEFCELLKITEEKYDNILERAKTQLSCGFSLEEFLARTSFMLSQPFYHSVLPLRYQYYPSSYDMS